LQTNTDVARTLQVIHGERIVALSPTGCPDHPYNAGFNQEIRNARNGRPNFELRWKNFFEDFKAEHEANKAREAEKLSVLQRQMRMTGHQKHTMQSRQDEISYQQRKEREDLAKLENILQSKQGAAATIRTAGVPSPLPSQTVPPVAEASDRDESPCPDPGELAFSIGAVTDEEGKLMLLPLWLYSDVFGNLDSEQGKGGTLGDWMALNLEAPVEKELAMATPEWLEEELYRKPDVREEMEMEPELTSTADAMSTPLEPEDELEVGPTNREADKGLEVQDRRKDTKQAKK
jgi:hypothetical protein